MSDLLLDYIRKPFHVKATRVTPLNIEALAEECEGKVLHDGDKEGQFSRDYIKVPVDKPQSVRQTMAHIGDWLVLQGRRWKVYPDNQFRQTFETPNKSASPSEIKKFTKPAGKKRGKGPNPSQMPRKRPVGTPAEKPLEATAPEAAAVRRHEELGEGVVVGGNPSLAPRDNRMQMGDPELEAAGLPQSFEEGFAPVYRDQEKAYFSGNIPPYIDRYAKFRQAVLDGRFAVSPEVSRQMNRIDHGLVVLQPAKDVEPGAETAEEIAYNNMAGREIIEQEASVLEGNAAQADEIQTVAQFVNGEPADSVIITVDHEDHGPSEMVVKISEQYDRQKGESSESWKARLQDQQINPQAFYRPERGDTITAGEGVTLEEANAAAATLPEKPKPMTLDELNAMPGDPRSAQEIMAEGDHA